MPVYAGPFGDLLQWDSQCHLTDGDTIFVLPEDSAEPRVVPLHVALLGRQHWSRQPRLPEPSCHGISCVVFGADNILHINSRGHHGAFRTQIANSIGVQSRFLRLDSSRPRVWNAAIGGFPCRSVVIASDIGASDHTDPLWILVDARGLFLGWRAVAASNGQVSCRDILDGLLSETRLWLEVVVQGTFPTMLTSCKSELDKFLLLRFSTIELYHSMLDMGTLFTTVQQHHQMLQAPPTGTPEHGIVQIGMITRPLLTLPLPIVLIRRMVMNRRPQSMSVVVSTHMQADLLR